MEGEFNEIYDDEDDSNGMKAQLCLSSFYCRHEFIQTKWELLCTFPSQVHECGTRRMREIMTSFSVAVLVDMILTPMHTLRPSTLA